MTTNELKELAQKAIETPTKISTYGGQTRDIWSDEAIELGQYCRDNKQAVLELCERVEKQCVWAEQEYAWETTCGNAFTLDNGTPADNKMLFCPYCGGSLKESEK